MRLGPWMADDKARILAETLGPGAVVLEVVRAGRTPEELSREFEPPAQAIWNWVRQVERDEGRREDGLTSAERAEIDLRGSP